MQYEPRIKVSPMIKIGSFFRKSIVENIKKDISASESIFVVQYSGIASASMTALRNLMRANKSRLLVAKNSLILKALKAANAQGLDNLLEGQSAVIFGQKDIALVTKALVKFTKENQNLIVKGGLYNNQVLNLKEIESISKLPSRELLVAQVVGALQAPLAGLVSTLRASLNKFVIVLNQIKEQKK